MMTIDEIENLYYKEFKTKMEGNAICAVSLSFNEKRENKKKALQEIEKYSKEDLIRYILKDTDRFGIIL